MKENTNCNKLKDFSDFLRAGMKVKFEETPEENLKEITLGSTTQCNDT